MMEAPKYIVVKMFSGLSTFDIPIIFPAIIGHNDMAQALGYKPEKVLAAGFVMLSPKKYSDSVVNVATYGKSVSLGVESRPEDASLIRKALALDED
jgi:hypothetical protein